MSDPDDPYAGLTQEQNGFRISAVGVAIAGYVLFLAGLYEAGGAFIAAAP